MRTYDKRDGYFVAPRLLSCDEASTTTRSLTRRALSVTLLSRVLSLVFGLFVLGCAMGPCQGRDMNQEKVRVYKADGSKQCDKKSGLSVEQMVSELQGIEIFSKEKKHDGQVHMTVCGGVTGQVNVYEIKKADLERAIGLGFQEFK